MTARSILLAICLALTGLFVVQCSEAPETKQEAKQPETSGNTDQVKLLAEMKAVALSIVQESPRERTYAQIEAIVPKYPEKALLAFVSDKYREIDPVPARRIVSQLAEAGFKKFGTANWQFYHALYVGTGIDTPPDPQRALAILDMPASGSMRSSLTLRAKMLMRLGKSSNAPAGRIEELLKQASALGDGEAAELLRKLGPQN